MKRYSLIVLLLLMALPSMAARREKKEFILPYKHDINISWGIGPASEMAGNYSSFSHDYQGGLDNIYRNYMVRGITTGVISADYAYQVSKVISVGAQLDCSVTKHTEMSSITGKAAHQFKNYTIAGLATAKCTYVRRQYFRMYTAVGLGLRYQGAGQQNEIRNNLHEGLGVAAFWIPYGFSVGKKVYASFEIIAGTESMGGRMGIGYRF